jgi:hypothetical protein
MDVIGTVRLLHRVFEFLAQQSPERLSSIADGRCRLALSEAGSLPGASSPTAEATPVQEPPSAPVVLPRARKAPPRRTVAAAGDEAVDYSAIATELRARESVDAGVAYLGDLRIRGRRPGKNDLIGIGKEMGLTLPKSIAIATATRRLVDHAIGARRKYAGLESW